MPNTLRRKMFKLGGETNTHGVGLTSGLNYNRPGYKKGGEVTTPIGVGSGKQPMVPGPDGKLREGHVAPAIMGLGNLLFGGFPRLLMNPMARRYGYKGAQQISKALTDPKKRSFYEAAIRRGGERAGIKSIARNEGIARRGKFLRALDIGAPTVYGAGIGTALGERAGLIDPERTNIEKYGTMIPQAALDYLSLPGYGSMGLQAGLQTPGEGGDVTTLTDLISGKAGDKNVDTPGPTTVPESEPAKMQATQEEAFDALVEDAREREEMYYKMLGEQRDPIGTLGKGFRQLGALYDEDRSKALAAAGDVMQADLDADKEVRRQAKAMAVEDVVGEGKQIQQAKISLMANPQLTADQRVQGLQSIDAVYQYDASSLPLDRKGNAKVEDMSEGRLYFDFTGQKPGYYMLINGKALQVDPSKMTTA